MPILKLIRYQNLILLALTQLLIHYALFRPFGVDLMLSDFGLVLLMLSTLCIAAAGNIINDINDVETDRINKPEKVIVGTSISESRAYNLFMALNVIGIGLGFYVSMKIGKNEFFAIFVITSLLLYLYATTIKPILIVSSLVVSALVALSIMLVPIFDLLPLMVPQNREAQLTFFRIAVDYAAFAFILNFVREIIKDIEDIDGDHKAQMQTLPIVLGRERAKNVAFILSLLPIVAVIYYLVTYLYQHQVLIGYFLIAVIAPLIYASTKLFSAKTKRQFHHISSIYKLAMLTGILSMLLYPLVLN